MKTHKCKITLKENESIIEHSSMTVQLPCDECGNPVIVWVVPTDKDTWPAELIERISKVKRKIKL